MVPRGAIRLSAGPGPRYHRRVVPVRALVVCLMVGAAAPAYAGGRTSKVTIETDPPGAKVYFGLKEDGEVCTTPCTVDAPVGETPIIVEAENRRPVIENLIVTKKSGRPQKVRYKLEPAIGGLVVEGGDGGTVKVDDQEVGKAPGRIDGLIAGPHHVVIERGGKPVFDEFLEIESGRDATATVGEHREREPAPVREAAEAPIDEIDRAPEPTAPPRPAAAAFALGVATDVGFRQFSYRNNRTPATQRDDREGGQLLGGPTLEVWPTRILRASYLRGLSVFARVQLGLNAQDVTVLDSATGARMATSMSTIWRSVEVSARHRWQLGAGSLEVGGGFVQDRYQFHGNSAEVALVPDANYKVIRIGARAALRVGPIEPFISGENRIVLSGGALARRYTLGSSASGLRGTIGAALHLGRFEVRAEAGLSRYTWTFRPDTGDSAQADGGVDEVENVQLVVCYAR